MDTQVGRVLEWREQKRKAGYQPLTVWLKADVKHLIEDLASQRRQDLAEVISAAIRAYSGVHQKHPEPAPVDAATVRRLVAEYVEELSAGPAPVAPVSDVPLPTPRMQDAVLMRGEYGWLVQAVRTAARELGRFTGQQMARHVNVKVDHAHGTLRHLARRGELIKKGRLYWWVDGQAPDA